MSIAKPRKLKTILKYMPNLVVSKLSYCPDSKRVISSLEDQDALINDWQNAANQSHVDAFQDLICAADNIMDAIQTLLIGKGLEEDEPSILAPLEDVDIDALSAPGVCQHLVVVMHEVSYSTADECIQSDNDLVLALINQLEVTAPPQFVDFITNLYRNHSTLVCDAIDTFISYVVSNPE